MGWAARRQVGRPSDMEQRRAGNIHEREEKRKEEENEEELEMEMEGSQTDRTTGRPLSALRPPSAPEIGGDRDTFHQLRG